MSVPVWVSADAPYCRPDDSVQDAMRQMTRWDCDSLPVCDADRKLVGSISMRTVCLYADVSGRKLAGMRVRDALESETASCIASDQASEVLRRMSRARLWSLPVLDRHRALIGTANFSTLQRSVEGHSDLIRIDGPGSCDESPSLQEAGFEGWRVSRMPMELRSPGGERRRLPRAELNLLLALIEHAGSVVTRDVLMNAVCNRDWDPTDRYVDVLVSSLRNKFGECASNARAIMTVQGVGYLLMLRVQSPLTRSRKSRGQLRRAPASPAGPKRTVEQPATLRDQLSPETLQEIERIYEEQHDEAAHAYCAKHRAIASICMSCNRVYRVVDSQGTAGGLSHGWCSTACAQVGAARAMTYTADCR